ncbi:hypothetical protein D0T84_20825 [Dysgonomonas sp. 521]|uniref:hypothetical protein n=1 Tax=Dysgonomonas sp. 521 TaxID=2302932 RepID=UPI0013D84466|nr:hypothetical protein [Dysgonomonas sp. 521]NDV97323.1 hypothetical protein [Dysgonomonas sp. 521]
MKKILLLFILGGLLFSCIQENDSISESPQKEKIEVNLTNDEYLSISENNIPDVTENQVIELLTNWDENSDKLKSSPDRPVFKIAKRLKNNTGTESDYYLASISENLKEGFAVVYGNKLFPQIACYIPEGSINDTIENEGLRIMYNISKESVESSLIRYNSLNKDSLKALAFQKISEEINKDVAYVKKILILMISLSKNLQLKHLWGGMSNFHC